MRQLTLLVALILAFFVMLSLFLMSHTSSLQNTPLVLPQTSDDEAAKLDEMARQAAGIGVDLLEADLTRFNTKNPVTPELTQGHVIMPTLGNETLKAELGRASWKLFHTILSRFPEHPTLDEREALKSYIHLFARLYPCGECAEHFQVLLANNPPQTSSREAASQWGCHIHNRVNEALNKRIFDCSTIAELYKCGCEEEDEKAKDNSKTETQASDGRRPPDSGRTATLKFENDGLTRGG